MIEGEKKHQIIFQMASNQVIVLTCSLPLFPNHLAYSGLLSMSQGISSPFNAVR